MSREQKIQCIEDMIKSLKKSINNASQLGDIQAIKTISSQIAMMQKKIKEI